jgi:GNAT superfamily N-acetyltransferase
MAQASQHARGHVVLRRATPADARALATIHLAGREAIALTNALHTWDETEAYHAHLIATADVRVALDSGGAAIGYAARAGDVLAQLYVLPEHFRRGAGAALLSAMLEAGPLRLFCFAHNARALAFYARFGAVEIGREAGPENEEGLPGYWLALPAP